MSRYAPTAPRRIAEPSPAAVAVHALAQPLSVAASTSELLVTDWEQLTDADRRDLADRVDRSVRRLADLLRRVDPIANQAPPVGRR